MLTTYKGKLLLKIKFSDQPSERSCVVRSGPAHRVEDSSSNPGPGENFSLKLKTQDLSDG